MCDDVRLPKACRRLSISMKALASWMRAAKAGKLEGVSHHRRPLAEIEAELGWVKRELAGVKKERDFSIKFATYFTQEVPLGTTWLNRCDGLPGATSVPLTGCVFEGLSREAQRAAVVSNTAATTPLAGVFASRKRIRARHDPERLQSAA